MAAPRKGDRGAYHQFNADGTPYGPVDHFTVTRVEGNLCYVVYDRNPDTPSSFIWRFKQGNGFEMNRLHDWPGKLEEVSA